MAGPSVGEDALMIVAVLMYIGIAWLGLSVISALILEFVMVRRWHHHHRGD